MRGDLRAFLDRAQEARLDPPARRLLVGIAQGQDQLVRPFRTDEAQPHRQALHLPHRHGEVRVAGNRGEAEEILREARTRGLQMPVLGGDGLEGIEEAGAIADGVILNWMPAAHVPRAIAAIAAGAQRAGRALADIDIACYIRVCVTDNLEAARQWMRRELTGYAIVDAYHAYFTACGFGADSMACRTAWQQGDRAGAMRCISDTMVHALAAIGRAEACRTQLATFVDAGVTLPIVFPFSYEADPVPSVLRTLQAIPTA